MKYDKREALREAFAEELYPFLKELGFKSSRRPRIGKDGCYSLPCLYRRQRQGYNDEINIHWDWNFSPRFTIEYRTDQQARLDLMPEYGRPGFYYGRIHPFKRAWWHIWLWIPEPWFGHLSSVDRTIELAKIRILALDEFLRTGNVSKDFLSLD